LDQNFAASAPNEVWVTDITYMWLYLAGIKDLFTCELVGYAMAERMTQELTGRALFRAVQQKRQVDGLIHHLYRASQYCANDYRKLLEQFGMQASMSQLVISIFRIIIKVKSSSSRILSYTSANSVPIIFIE
jgi:putative transposase